MRLLELQWNTIQAMLDWRVTLDILLIGLAIFSLYHFLKATGTWKIVTGVLIAGGVFILASLLELRGIVWIYTYLSPVILISMVIIFQPEIRKLLERAASIAGKRLVEDTQTARHIAEAVFDLAGRREGAIFVLPGKDALRPWTSEGVRAEARVSYALLMSLFDPHSPGHDGAVIVENGKVDSFGVRLPLSTSGVLTEEFGTRHHAGLGLAEATDAMAIVVSEERGEVRVFVHANEHRVADRHALLKMIRAHCQRTASHTTLIRPGRRKGGRMIELGISFVIALVFWSSVVLTRTEIREGSYLVPVKYIHDPGIRVRDTDRVDDVHIRIAGPAPLLDRIRPSRLAVQVDCTGGSAGQRPTVRVAENLRLPRGIRLLSAEPEYFSVTLLTDTNATPR